MLRKSLSVFVLCLVATGAFAITYIVPTDRDMVKRAEAIVVGAALTSYVQQNAAGGIETVTPFAVHEIIKGSDLGFTVDVHEPGGHLRNVYRIIPGVPRFAAGEEALIFLTRNQNGEWNVTDLALGRFTFRNDS